MSQTPVFPSSKELFEPEYFLPKSYNDTYIVLMIRDPQWIYAYWEVSEDTAEFFCRKFGRDNWENSCLALRLFWKDFHKTFKLKDEADNWYVYLGNKGIPRYGELGRILADGSFITLAVSNDLSEFGVKPSYYPGAARHQLIKEILNSWKHNISYRKGW